MRRAPLLISVCALLLAAVPAWGTALAAPRVALILTSDLADHGYLDNLRKGLAQAQKELGATCDIIASTDDDAREALFLQAAKTGGYDLIITAEAATRTLLMNHAGNFRNVRFASIDGQVKAPNIASVVFADAQAAFLCGFAAATLAAQSVPGQPGVVGWVGSFDVTPQRTMLNAFRDGARLAHADVRVLTAFTSSFTSREAGHAAAQGLYAQGASVIMHAAGAAGLGVIDAAREHKRLVIGMHQDQRPLAPKHVLLSQCKAADAVVLSLIKSVGDGAFPGGKTQEMNLENHGVSITPLNPDIPLPLPQELSTRLQELRYEIQRSSIKLGPPPNPGRCDCL